MEAWQACPSAEGSPGCSRRRKIQALEYAESSAHCLVPDESEWQFI